jgi:hypothetical protein
MVQVVEHLLAKCEALSSNHSNARRKVHREFKLLSNKKTSGSTFKMW